MFGLLYHDPRSRVRAETLMEVASLLGAGGSLELKSFFKDLMLARQVLPPEVIYRPKTWMQSPTAEWLRGPLGRTIETVVLSRSAGERGYFDMARVQRPWVNIVPGPLIIPTRS